MIKFSPRFLLSPRFFALPLLALCVIVALAQATANKPKAGAVAATKVERAVNCAAANPTDSRCAIAGGDVVVR